MLWKNTSVVPNESGSGLCGFVCVCEERLGAAGMKELQIWGERLTACWDPAHRSYSSERQQRPLDRTKPHTQNVYILQTLRLQQKANHINRASFDHTLFVLLSDGKWGIYSKYLERILNM